MHGTALCAQQHVHGFGHAGVRICAICLSVRKRARACLPWGNGVRAWVGDTSMRLPVLIAQCDSIVSVEAKLQPAYHVAYTAYNAHDAYSTAHNAQIYVPATLATLAQYLTAPSQAKSLSVRRAAALWYPCVCPAGFARAAKRSCMRARPVGAHQFRAYASVCDAVPALRLGRRTRAAVTLIFDGRDLVLSAPVHVGREGLQTHASSHTNRHSLART